MEPIIQSNAFPYCRHCMPHGANSRCLGGAPCRTGQLV
jgi:hypothetical protein